MIEWKKYDDEDQPAFNSIHLVNAEIENNKMYQCTAVKKGTGWFDIFTDEWVPRVTHYAEINLPEE